MFHSPPPLSPPLQKRPHHSSTSPPSSPDKFTKNRAVGQSHRDNERTQLLSLEQDIQTLRDDNLLLYTLNVSKKSLPLPLASSPPQIYQYLPEDRPEALPSLGHAPHSFFKLPRTCQNTLGQKYVSLTMIVVMLEFIAIRRNLICDFGMGLVFDFPSEDLSSSSSSSAGFRKRRRHSLKAAPSYSSTSGACEFALRGFRNEAARRRVNDRVTFVDHMFGALGIMLEKWSLYECYVGAREDHDEQVEHVFMERLESPTRTEMAVFGSPDGGRRRGEGAKRCSRCGVVKVSGSGHGRSQCLDGVFVSSSVPYYVGGEHGSASGGSGED